jgi:hypothetical protein
MLKHKIKDYTFQTVEEIVTIVKIIWEGLILEDMQSVFFNWIEYIEQVIEHWENTTLTDIKRLSDSLSHSEARGLEHFAHLIC